MISYISGVTDSVADPVQFFSDPDSQIRFIKFNVTRKLELQGSFVVNGSGSSSGWPATLVTGTYRNTGHWYLPRVTELREEIMEDRPPLVPAVHKQYSAVQ